MDRNNLKDKYNNYYKEYKRKEFYQLTQFDKLFILLMDILDSINNIKLTPNNPVPTTDNTVTSKSLDIVFNNGFCSNNFTLPSANSLLINPKLDKDITINFQIAYNNDFIDTDLIINIPANTSLVIHDLNKFTAVINKKDSCRLCSNEVLSTTFVLYYV